ncbi:hypothetical protein BHM03_00052820 [Ensete ventricosum]|nr:hypothetical protein BHM03_00052820 [Ensete ventricosum]
MACTTLTAYIRNDIVHDISTPHGHPLIAPHYRLLLMHGGPPTPIAIITGRAASPYRACDGLCPVDVDCHIPSIA